MKRQLVDDACDALHRDDGAPEGQKMSLHHSANINPTPRSTVVRYLALPCLLLLCAPNHIDGLISPALKGSVSTRSYSVSTRTSTALWQKRRSSGGAYRRADNIDHRITTDDEDITATTKSTTKTPAVIASDGRKKPTLAEQEDMEEERLAEEEKAEQWEKDHPSSQYSTPSTLYTDIYDSAAAKAAELEPKTEQSSMMTASDLEEDPLNRTPAKDIELAQKRDAIQNNRLNEMFAEEDANNAARQAKIKELMEEDDKAWKEERKKRMLGKYAGVESWEEVETMLGEDRKEEAKGTCVHTFCCDRFAISYNLDLYMFHFHSFFPYCSTLLYYRTGNEKESRETSGSDTHHARTSRYRQCQYRK